MSSEISDDPIETPASEEARERAFYGRRKGKALRLGQATAIAELLPRLAVDLSRPPIEPRALFEVPVDDVWMESGFGGGEHLIETATANPSIGFVGAEPFVNGMAKALVALHEAGLEHRIRLHHADSVPLLDALAPASLGRFYLLYPDPWPKKRHWKRRFVQRDNLDRIARVLRPGGEFRFASDWAPYVDWALAEVLAHPAFEWTARVADDWRKPWAGWPGTRYEEKAIREGRTPAYLIFRRI
ncbi:MAG: tRNA (guanosine(46)-N7)-methyltransferase TrmB [Phyllobacteriaceae bacterium]|nr:tRNA (guanosine(46)-N7)-methyltransferase TrmB [Phyllobacteriaceae bacterium]